MYRFTVFDRRCNKRRVIRISRLHGTAEVEYHFVSVHGTRPTQCVAQDPQTYTILLSDRSLWPMSDESLTPLQRAFTPPDDDDVITRYPKRARSVPTEEPPPRRQRATTPSPASRNSDERTDDGEDEQEDEEEEEDAADCLSCARAHRCIVLIIVCVWE